MKTVKQLRERGHYWAIVPVGTQDEYAAGYDGNAFETEAEAWAAILDLVGAIGGEWDVIEAKS